MRRIGVLLFLPLALTACGSKSSASGGVSASEARQLNEAAAMLDANSTATIVDTGQADDDDDNEAAQGNTQ
ncbi:hypothetical protein BH09PSE4_BH09PSE4_01740 [soil metagenome]